MKRWMMLTAIVAAISAADAQDIKPLDVRRIWDAGKHNAFTDLTYWSKRWWCVFREADDHVGGDGRIRVIVSADGTEWQSAALIAERDIDLRDPKLSVTPDNRLMIVAGGSVYLGTKDLKGRQSRVMFSKDGRHWTEPRRVLSEGDWLWRVTWFKGKAYGVAYNTHSTKQPDGKLAQADVWDTKLVCSEDGEKWTLVKELEVSGRANETTLRFSADGKMIAMVRREALSKTGWIGQSYPPYTSWTWRESNHRFGGPNFIQLPDGQWIAGTRNYGPGPERMLVARLHEDARLEPLTTLPSGGDSSYPGMVWRDNTLWVSYYASHEGKASIYLAKLAIPTARAATQRFIAIDDVCAWPNLATLRDGTIIATIFNQPSHGRAEGDVECWATTDGRHWTRRGLATRHDPGTNRMNVAAGVAMNGDLVVIASGWELKPKGESFDLVRVLPAWVSRSDDGGATWNVVKDSFPAADPGHTPYIPFGDIHAGADGALRAAAYSRNESTKVDSVWLLRSEDDGRSWTRQSRIAEVGNETAIFPLGGGRWIAAVRAHGAFKFRLNLHRSEDDGATWSGPETLTEEWQHPGHLARLADGRLLLTYGNRQPGRYGVMAKWSDDEGRTWSPPRTLVDDATNGDCGYPSSVELKDGTIVTAYYARGVASHQPRYHMGTVIWMPPARSRP